MAIGVSGADKNDLEIVERGSQTINPPLPNPENQHFIHNLHQMTPQYLTGKPLDKLTNLFVETLCEDIDARFPPNDPKSYDWETLDLCEFVKTTWAHASITSLFGTNIYRIWPEIQKWLWDFDEHFPSLMTKMPRFVLPQAWALRDEGWEKCAQWEREARAAEATGEFGEDPEWDPYWGMKFVRLRAHYIKDSGMSDKVRAGNQMVFIWGVSQAVYSCTKLHANTLQLNANAIPIAMQTITQLVLHPQIHNAVIQEISEAKTGPTNFDMRKVTSSPRFKSVYIEALRWATASPSPRVVKHDVKVGPYTLRRGNMVIVHSRTLQMDSKTWSVPGVPESDPENFWPERFLSEDDSNTESHSISENAEAEANYSNDVLQAKKQDEERRKMQAQEEKVRTLSLRPFGGGTTLCPGRHFANNEIMGGIAALLLRLEIEVVQEELEKNGVPKPGLKKQGGLLPDRPLIVRMRRKRV